MTIISFKVVDTSFDIGVSYDVSYDSSMTIRNFLLDFGKKHSIKEPLNVEKYPFLYKGKVLNMPIYLDKTLEDLRVKNHSQILLKDMAHLIGTGPTTVDVSKNLTKECEPAKAAPSYRDGCDGLNIRSICKNTNCEAYNDTIYVKIGYVQDWDLCQYIKKKDVLCPSCRKMVKPINYYFYECNYTIDYIKEEGDELKDGSINGCACNGKYKYFDEKGSGNATFSSLVFNVTKL